MKKICLLIFCMILGGIVQVVAQNPIPSFNVIVNHSTNFQENRGGTSIVIPVKGERAMKINVKGSSSKMATIWAFSMDGQDKLGPYYGHGGETVSIPIDNRTWGIIVHSPDPIEVDVWIEE